jgi:Ca-activated chloride channel family protein
LVPTSVIDEKDHPVIGLERRHFRVFDNRVEQKIESFSMEDEPLAVGIVFDTSGSMGGKLRRSRLAVKAFLDTANPDDEFLLVEFNNRATVTVPLTKDSDQIENRLVLTEAKGSTALMDAIYLGLSAIKRSEKARQALLIFSDGGDNHSRYRQREIERFASESDVSIYSLGTFDSVTTPEERDGPNLLSWIAEQTGGRAYSAYERDLPDIAGKIGSQLRHRYILGFSPRGQPGDGRYHSLQVKMVRTRGLPPLLASWRLGYFDPDDAQTTSLR